VLTATVPIRSAVLEEVPSALRRTFTLLELATLCRQAPGPRGRAVIAWAAAHRRLAAGEPLDVVDPMGRSPEVHRDAAAVIDSATADVAQALGFDDRSDADA
jgi:protein-tyrosine phosphatase